MELLKIDGSTGEGGGQIVRLALFLSIIKGTPIEIFNIRRGKRKPGLKRQHLHVIKALEAITESTCEGAHLGSQTVRFSPGKIKGGQATVEFGTAGSIPLFLQTLLPVSIFASSPVSLTIKGGTDVPMGPTLEFTRHLYLPFLRPLAYKLELKVVRRGFYPVGDGEVRLLCHPKQPREGLAWEEFLEHLQTYGPLEPGSEKIPSIAGISIASSSLKERKVAERQAQKAQSLLDKHLNISTHIETLYQPSSSPGSAITLWLKDPQRTLGADAQGARGKPAEKVAEGAVNILLKEYASEAQVDRHLADHLVPWIGLMGGEIRVSRITQHLETGVWLYNLMIPEKPVKLKGNILSSLTS